MAPSSLRSPPSHAQGNGRAVLVLGSHREVEGVSGAGKYLELDFVMSLAFERAHHSLAAERWRPVVNVADEDENGRGEASRRDAAGIERNAGGEGEGPGAPCRRVHKTGKPAGRIPLQHQAACVDIVARGERARRVDVTVIGAPQASATPRGSRLSSTRAHSHARHSARRRL